MPFVSTPDLLKYNLTRTEIGVLLSIWEPAPLSENRVKPFLFMANHRLPSADEAEEILNAYLAAYRSLV
jgi:hypothetical protein